MHHNNTLNSKIKRKQKQPLLLLLLTLALFQPIFASTLILKAGWNLTGNNKDSFNVNLTIPEAITAWTYTQANGWYASSPNGVYANIPLKSANAFFFEDSDKFSGILSIISERL